MHVDDERGGTGNAASLAHDPGDLTEAEDRDEERPDDAVTCPLLDTPVHFTDCALCDDRGWVLEEDIAAYLGPHRVECLFCDGEGWEDGAGPVSWTCSICLGTGQMPVKALGDVPDRGQLIEDQDLSGVDLSGLDLSHLAFSACDFSRARFDGADLTDASFVDCQFAGANPETAASLEGTEHLVEGLSEEQLTACAARGAIVTDEGDVAAEAWLGHR